MRQPSEVKREPEAARLDVRQLAAPAQLWAFVGDVERGARVVSARTGRRSRPSASSARQTRRRREGRQRASPGRAAHGRGTRGGRAAADREGGGEHLTARASAAAADAAARGEAGARGEGAAKASAAAGPATIAAALRARTLPQSAAGAHGAASTPAPTAAPRADGPGRRGRRAALPRHRRVPVRGSDPASAGRGEIETKAEQQRALGQREMYLRPCGGGSCRVRERPPDGAAQERTSFL